jgi:hypothetical protein
LNNHYAAETETDFEILLFGASKEQLSMFKQSGLKCIPVRDIRETVCPYELATKVALFLRSKGIEPPEYSSSRQFEDVEFHYVPEEDQPKKKLHFPFGKGRKKKEDQTTEPETVQTNGDKEEGNTEKLSNEQDDHEKADIDREKANIDHEEADIEPVEEKTAEPEKPVQSNPYESAVFINVPAPAAAKEPDIADGMRQNTTGEPDVPPETPAPVSTPAPTQKPVPAPEPTYEPEATQTTEPAGIMEEKETSTDTEAEPDRDTTPEEVHVPEEKKQERKKPEKQPKEKRPKPVKETKEEKQPRPKPEKPKAHVTGILSGITGAFGGKKKDEYAGIETENIGHNQAMKPQSGTAWNPMFSAVIPEAPAVPEDFFEPEDLKEPENQESARTSMEDPRGRGDGLIWEPELGIRPEQKNEPEYAPAEKIVDQNSLTPVLPAIPETRPMEVPAVAEPEPKQKRQKKFLGHISFFVTEIRHGCGCSYTAGSIASALTDIYGMDVYLGHEKGTPLPDNYMVQEALTESDLSMAYRNGLIVYDRGLYSELGDEARSELARSDVRFMVCTAGESDIRSLAMFMHQERDAKGWIYVFNHVVNKKQQKEISTLMHGYEYIILPQHDYSDVPKDLQKEYRRMINKVVHAF